MEQRNDILRKSVALISAVAIAAAVFLLAPPASRLFVALLALPLEVMIVSSFRGDSRERWPH